MVVVAAGRAWRTLVMADRHEKVAESEESA